MPQMWQVTWTVLRALMGVSPPRLQQSSSNATRLDRDGKRRRYRDGKNTRSYIDNYANGSPPSETTPAQPAPTMVALAHSLGGDYCRRGFDHDHCDRCVYEVRVQLNLFQVLTIGGQSSRLH